MVFESNALISWVDPNFRLRSLHGPAIVLGRWTLSDFFNTLNFNYIMI
jgi:hypothetical protein